MKAKAHLNSPNVNAGCNGRLVLVQGLFCVNNGILTLLWYSIHVLLLLGIESHVMYIWGGGGGGGLGLFIFCYLFISYLFI